MKNIFRILAVILALSTASCDDEDKCDSVRVYVNGREALNKSIDNPERLSVKEICKLGELWLKADGPKYWIEDAGGQWVCETSIGQHFMLDIPDGWDGVGWIDTANCRLRFAADVINYFELDRENHSFFLERFKFVLTNNDGDTIAYVPTAQRMAVVDELLVLFDNKEKNWNRICELFNDAFIFIPCTGEEWNELAEAGLN